MEYELAYNDKISTFLDEIKAFAERGFVTSAIQPSISEAAGNVYKYVLLMERSTKPNGKI